MWWEGRCKGWWEGRWEWRCKGYGGRVNKAMYNELVSLTLASEPLTPGLPGLGNPRPKEGGRNQ